jgi:hypothetical protein
MGNTASIQQVIDSIEDELPDFKAIDDAKLIRLSRTRLHMIVGYWITYYLLNDPIQRAIYLGDTAKQVQKAYEKWSKTWRVSDG